MIISYNNPDYAMPSNYPGPNEQRQANLGRGCSSVEWRANAAAIFLIAQAFLAIVFLWATRDEIISLELFFGTCCFCLMIAAGGLVLRSTQAKKKHLWPLYTILIVLALGGVFMAVTAGTSINQLRNRCPGSWNGFQEHSSCNGARVLPLIVRVAVCLPMLCIYGGLILVFAKSRVSFERRPEQEDRWWRSVPQPSASSELSSYTTRAKDRPPSYQTLAHGDHK